MLFVGVDVGAGGGIAIIDELAAVHLAVRMPDTDRDVLDALGWCFREAPILPRWGMLEKVHSSPQMGVKSAFSFGQQYGRVRMALAAAVVPFDEVTPFKWQRRLECLTGGDKNVSKMRAQQLFPLTKVTHYLADALLLAEFCRRTHWVDTA
jgi:hypothetical protein